ncbi:molybdopterin-guanine dinucleotide biosynthesis protein B [Deferribacterales bacterium Es71-Z0220]|uniref:molybdopterin-guanine dinucleotide biosynthesis protein B n=1 Tax=Deferrivibrio essentukiensis TaxID=2880922 RepID=UPI001F62512F|nr:molybdopterin-guanine dinucleotide biosynthesis protein B [Deferrivibrio essentukiensis]MCB4205453.1 molybdopterin-guanine dinucleotide biosynthesis protein B [Deferrivibrio essentukiensis]
MVPIICFVGASDCGKTTLLEKVISVLRNRGYKVGIIKNDTHGFEIDKEGKDTYRLKQAGANSVIISGPDKYAIISDADKFYSLDDFAFYIGDKTDIILTEGFKSSKKPKIELFLDGTSTEILCKDDETLVAVATNNKEKIKMLTKRPILDINNPEEISNFIEQHYLNKKKRKLFLMVNGKKIKIKDFVEDIVTSTIIGMVSELKDCSDPKDIRIVIKDE